MGRKKKSEKVNEVVEESGVIESEETLNDLPEEEIVDESPEGGGEVDEVESDIPPEGGDEFEPEDPPEDNPPEVEPDKEDEVLGQDRSYVIDNVISELQAATILKVEGVEFDSKRTFTEHETNDVPNSKVIAYGTRYYMSENGGDVSLVATWHKRISKLHIV